MVLDKVCSRGDERPDSDVDLLMVIIRKAPVFLADVIEDGQVLLDLEGTWRELLVDYPSIAQAADVADAELRKRAQAALAELTSDAR